MKLLYKKNYNLVIYAIVIIVLIIIIYNTFSYIISYKPENHTTYEIINHAPVTSTEYVLPKIVWTYWNQEKPPNTIKLIFENNKKVLSGWDFRILNEKNVTNYFDYFPKNYQELRESHKSDWIRLSLLKKYGGCWIDASLIINSVSDLDNIYNESLNKHSDYTGFWTNCDDCLINNDPSTFIESWFILCPKDSKIIRDSYKEFLKACKLGFATYRDEILRAHIICKTIYEKNSIDEEGLYLTIYACIQVAISKNKNKQNIILYCSNETMFKIMFDCVYEYKGQKEHDAICVLKKLRDDIKASKKIPFIKLTSFHNALFNKIDISNYFE